MFLAPSFLKISELGAISPVKMRFHILLAVLLIAATNVVALQRRLDNGVGVTPALG